MMKFIALAAAMLSGVNAVSHLRSSFNSQNSVLALDQDMRTSMLVRKATPIFNPCGGVTCGDVRCPSGFHQETVEGHCELLS